MRGFDNGVARKLYRAMYGELTDDAEDSLADDRVPARSFAELSGFGLIRFKGVEARQFLQGQLSCDVDSLEVGRAQYGSYNTPKGRILASFLLWRDEHGYILQLPRLLRETIQKRLAMHILRAKVETTDASAQFRLLGIAGAGVEAGIKPLFRQIPSMPLTMTEAHGVNLLRLDAHRFQIMASPERAPELRNLLGKEATPVSEALWDWTNIRAGIPYITPATQDQFVPQMVNLDLIGGVSFSKGCYPGQEIVARMHYLGRLKQRMYLANIAGREAPQPGDKLYSRRLTEQASGMIVNASPSPDGGYDVLAVIQIECANADDVHWRTIDGTKLTLLALPYSGSA
jgi:folate-binding protein YgfZ